MKTWVRAIQSHVETWSGRKQPSWIPKYAYHFTDVRNAAAILDRGEILSRVEAEQLGVMVTDNASPEMIQRTRQEHLRYARLYFRPMTPTQFRNEGIRPADGRQLNAHCPVPVFFCFDLVEVLARDDTEFSDGNMASDAVRHDSTEEFFGAIPFDQVYHTGPVQKDATRAITFHRNAEVLVPGRLPLRPALRFVACRSTAEKQTLLYLTSASGRQLLRDNHPVGDAALFFRRWTYVEEVVPLREKIVLRFNRNTTCPGPLDARASFHCEGPPLTWDLSDFSLGSPVELVGRTRLPAQGELTIEIAGCLAYKNRISLEDSPF